MKLLVALLVPLMLIAGCATAPQMQLDTEVDRLCAIDGGLKIYETVSLPPEKFNKYGQVNFVRWTQGENALGPEYIWKYETTYLHPGGDPKTSPRMWRSHCEIIRRSDMRLLGETTSYSRYGGDPVWSQGITHGAPETHYSCPKKDAYSGDLIAGVFVKNDVGSAQ